MWPWVWIGWLAFLVIADVIADRTPGATFSEHCKIWFRGRRERIALALFFFVLYIHLVYGTSVIPVIAGGVLIGLIIGRWVKEEKHMFRFDRWLVAVFFSGIFTVATGGAAAFFTDGELSRGEIIIMIGMFIAGAGMYMKTHPPKLD